MIVDTGEEEGSLILISETVEDEEIIRRLENVVDSFNGKLKLLECLREIEA